MAFFKKIGIDLRTSPNKVATELKKEHVLQRSIFFTQKRHLMRVPPLCNICFLDFQKPTKFLGSTYKGQRRRLNPNADNDGRQLVTVWLPFVYKLSQHDVTTFVSSVVRLHCLPELISSVVRLHCLSELVSSVVRLHCLPELSMSKMKSLCNWNLRGLCVDSFV